MSVFHDFIILLLKNKTETRKRNGESSYSQFSVSNQKKNVSVFFLFFSFFSFCCLQAFYCLDCKPCTQTRKASRCGRQHTAKISTMAVTFQTQLLLPTPAPQPPTQHCLPWLVDLPLVTMLKLFFFLFSFFFFCYHG